MGKLTRMMAGVESVAAAAALVAGTVTAASAATNDPPKGSHARGVRHRGRRVQHDRIRDGRVLSRLQHDGQDPQREQPDFYSYDALTLGVNVPGNYKIKPKAGCTTIARPDGSGKGSTALDTTQRSSTRAGLPVRRLRPLLRRPQADLPGGKPGGMVFVAFAKDAITWAARSAAKGGTDAPASLNTAQLKAIFTCTDTNWKQVGGKSGAIKVYLPQGGSGTLSTWEKFMGITTLGACVSQAPEENEGTYARLQQRERDLHLVDRRLCGGEVPRGGCGKAPSKSQNQFGCNLSGFIVPEKISGVNRSAPPRCRRSTRRSRPPTGARSTTLPSTGPAPRTT